SACASPSHLCVRGRGPESEVTDGEKAILLPDQSPPIHGWCARDTPNGWAVTPIEWAEGSLGLDLPGTLPGAERPLACDQGEHDSLQLHHEPHLLRQGQI